MKMTLGKLCLALGLVLLFISPAQAEHKIQASFYLQMPRSLGHGDSPLLASQYKDSQKVTLQNFSLQSQFPTWAENIEVNLSYELEPLQPWLFDEVQTIKTRALSAKVFIGRIQTQFTENHQSEGTSITLDFEASCENLPLELKPNQAEFSGKIKIVNLGNQVALKLEESNTQWQAQAWSLGNFSCQGVKGYEKILRREIEKELQSSTSLQSQIHEQMKQKIQALQEDINQTIFKRHQIIENNKNFLAIFTPYQLENKSAEQGFHFSGDLLMRFRGVSRAKNSVETIPFQKTIGQSPHTAGPTLVVPIEIVTPLAEKLFANGNFTQKFTSDELGGFSDFMNSETQKKYAWPDLLNFKNDAQFQFHAFLVQTPEISGLKNVGERMELRLRSRVVLQMFAPRNGSYVPYVEWSSPIDAFLSVQAYQGRIWVKTLSATLLNWKATMNKEYVSKYRVKDTSIDSKRIGDALTDKIKSEQYNWQIPAWEVSDHLRYRVESLLRSETGLWMYWNPF
ncbi:MAG: hypothetical protein KDD33_02045 [Bdellovibrionales bacterium]|nr:hypothetical protein [Bdellovibrionales bacterium]